LFHGNAKSNKENPQTTRSYQAYQRNIGSSDLNRSKLADKICKLFGFFDPLGNKQKGGCMKALRELEKDGKLVLPNPFIPLAIISPDVLGSQSLSPLECLARLKKFATCDWSLSKTMNTEEYGMN